MSDSALHPDRRNGYNWITFFSINRSLIVLSGYCRIMKFNYKFRRLCGAYYGFNYTTDSFNRWGGSNLVYDSSGDYLISAVSNRIQVIDLKTSTVRTLPIEARSNIRCMDLSPNDNLLVVVDVQDYVMLVNYHRGVVLHRFRLKKRTKQVKFSPNGQYIAFTQGKHIQVWYTPTKNTKEFSPMILHRTYTGQADDTVCIAWSPDSSVIAAGSRDATVRIWTVNTTKNFEPVTLANHRKPIVGVHLISGGTDNSLSCIYSVSEDGALVTWEFHSPQNDNIQIIQDDNPMQSLGDDAVDFFSGGASSTSRLETKGGRLQSHQLVGGTWRVKSRHYFNQDDAVLSSVTYCEQGQLLAVGFSSGLFGIYEMPSVSNIHTLSVGSNQLVRACLLNKTGEWLALGCPQSQQLLVWEWRSETYVLKQRGHAYGMRRMAYSPDGVVICTGGEDGKLKLWNAMSGFCYVTLEKSHTAPITAVTFAKPSVVLSASLDGTVRAHDLHRYRTFRTFTSPTPVQFLSLACDPSGEIVCAGSTDPFHIYTWNMQTGKLLDVYTGHTGPVSDLCFQPTGGTLVSASWDGTVRLWDLYKGNVPTETLQHTTDVVCVTIRPDGKEVCSGTLGGLLNFWDVESGKLKFELDGRKDISGGRKMNDRMTADNNASSRYFTSVCYSADGAFVIAGGNSKYVCIYAVEQQILVKKFQVTFNRSLDGVLDEVGTCRTWDLVFLTQ